MREHLELCFSQESVNMFDKQQVLKNPARESNSIESPLTSNFFRQRQNQVRHAQVKLP